MLIKRILNNNTVLSEDDHGEEIVVKGKGIAYQHCIEDVIDPALVEKLFVLHTKEASNRYQQLLANTPADCIEVCEVMIDAIKEAVDQELSDKIYITLTDHICNLLERIQMGIVFDSGLLWDVKRLYRQEYQAGLLAVDIMRNAFHVKVSDEEAGFIALHIVNAQLNTEFHDVIEITGMIDDIYDIVESTFSLDIDKDSLEYTRFIMHLRVFFERILHHQHLQSEKSEVLLQSLLKEFPEQYACVRNVLAYVAKKYDAPMEGEVLYLLVHIIKLTDY